MLSAADLAIAYGPQVVLEGVSITLDAGIRGGLVGANGSGKTTLLRILAGQETPETGTITIARTSRVEYLPQRIPVPPEITVFDFADQGYSAEHALLQERQRAAETLVTDPHNTSCLTIVAEIDHTLEDRGYHVRQQHVSRVLTGLGFTTPDFHRLLTEFSGGWRMRAALARSLLARPDILLLDEPTNYLDSEARLWLSAFLRSFSGGVLLVSHDRAFLDDTITTIYELFQGNLKRYTGSYTRYEIQRRSELEQIVSAYESQQREIRRQEDFIRRFRATASKAKQVQSRVKTLEKTEVIRIPEHLRPISITLPPPLHSGKVVLEINDLYKTYGKLPVLSGLSLTLHRGERLAVAGLNGAGKSTLLRILSGQEAPDSGSVRLGTGVQSAYFAQDSAERLPTGQTIIDYISSCATTEARPRVRDILGSFLFSGDSVDKPLEVLSGGERSRIAMAALFVRPANLLIMDEPTNHLDMTSQEVLARALSHYEGTVIVVSHDRYFLREVATDVLALWPSVARHPDIPAERWQFYPGSYLEFEGAKLGQVFLTADYDSKEEITPTSEAVEYRRQKLDRGNLRKLERQEETLLADIERLEKAHQTLQEQMALPENYRDGERIRALQEELQQNEVHQLSAHQAWQRITEEMDELQG